MTPLETVTLDRLVNSKAASQAREDLSPGVHDVDLLVHVTGSIAVAPDTYRTPTVSIPVKEVLGLFVARSGATRESAVALLKQCLTEALSDGVRGAGAFDVDEVFKDVVDELVRDLPKTPVKGAVRPTIQVELLRAA